MIDDLPPLRDVIRDHNLRAEKSLGQNFILDQNLTDKIVRSAGDLSGYTVFEIGPGPGGLTRSLVRYGSKKVIAIEYDPRAVSALESLKLASDGALDVIHKDALDTDLTQLSDAPRAIIANLPYNIATVLLLKWLQEVRNDPSNYDFFLLMFQKEVADRLSAVPGTKAYGRLSVMAQWLCNVYSVFDLPPSAFVPPPKVTSSIVEFRPRKLEKKAPSFELMERITAAAFNQRRKMIRSSLGEYADAIREAQIDETLRAENLTVQDYVRICHAAVSLAKQEKTDYL